jgi:hypothetical protein
MLRTPSQPIPHIVASPFFLLQTGLLEITGARYMYSWKSIRIACFILLILPVVHLAYLVSRSTMESLDNSPAAWAREMDAYAKFDAGQALPENPIVVIGGQRVKLWRSLQDILAPRSVLMRGLGDAIIEDLTFNYSQLVGYYQPDTIVLLPGNSEFNLRDNKSAQQLVTAMRELVALDATHGVTQHFYIYTPLKTPLRPQDHKTIEETTRLLKNWAATEERVSVLNANTLLSDASGKPMARYFRGDGTNLNEHGYLRLSVLLQAQVDTDALTQGEYVTLP